MYKSASPVRLTKEWVKFLENIWFIEEFENNKDKFLFWIKDRLDDKKNDSDFFYFAEKYSLDFIKDLYDKESHLLVWLRKYMFSVWKSEYKDIFLNAIWYFLRDKIIDDFWKTEEFKKIKDENKD